jgi:hypothetical protein
MRTTDAWAELGTDRARSRASAIQGDGTDALDASTGAVVVRIRELRT